MVGVLVVWLAALTWSSVGSAANGGVRRLRAGGPVVAFVHGDSLQQGMAIVQTMQANLQMQMEAREKQLQEDALPLQEARSTRIALLREQLVRHRTMNWRSPSVGFWNSRRGLRTLQRAAEQDMFVAEQNMQAVMAEALRRHLEEHAREEGIDFVLNWGLSGEGVLYGTEPWDITADVLARINVGPS